MLTSLRPHMTHLLALLLVLGGAQTLLADDDLNGEWNLNYPAGSTPAVWTFSESEGEFSGSATVVNGRRTTNCNMSGELLFDILYFADVTCVTTPGNLTTTGKALFLLDGDNLAGIVVTFVGGVPVSFVELEGTRVVLQTPQSSARRR